MFKNYIENANFEDTGFSYTLSLIRAIIKKCSNITYNVLVIHYH